MKLKTLAYLSLITLVTSLSPAAHAQTFSAIYAFTGANGVYPYSEVTLRARGVLYGTTVCTQDCTGNGTVYQISHVGSNWVHTPILIFSGYAISTSPTGEICLSRGRQPAVLGLKYGF